MTDQPIRSARPHLWTGLALAGTALGVSTLPAAADMTIIGSGPERIWLVQAEGGEGGEAGPAVDAEGTALPLVAQLGLIEGALRTGADLQKAGRAAAAAEHVATLKADIFEVIEPDLDTHGITGLEPALDAAIAALTSGVASDETMNAAFAALADARAKDAEEPKEWFQATIYLLRKAGEEYGKGVAGGQVTDAGEYEESWGNFQAAKTLIETLALSSDDKVKAAADAAMAALAEVVGAYGGVAPKGAVTGDEGLFAAAAARIELAAYKVK